MSGYGPYTSSTLGPTSLHVGGSGVGSGSTSRRPSKLGASAGSNSKRKRSKRLGPQSFRRKIINCILYSALLLFSLGIYKGSRYFPTVLEGQGSSSATSFLHVSAGNGSFNTVAEDAHADITTQGLYEEIEFLDLDGGVWKQGWNVQYKGDEWDHEKLKVFVVPHSHNDPGWIRTVEEYYQERSRSILSTIVTSLKKDIRRKFIWEEMSYLERWWRDASDTEKDDLKRLVHNGQLEIVGGGWVMNDEANSHYYAIIEQMIAGNLWLLDTVGVAPKNAWAIDPFGHSATMAYLLRRMGFKNMLIQRTHYEVKKALARKQNLEFMWRQSWDSSNSTDIFCHMMPFYSYDIPHTCGPEPGVCCQFDYWRLPGVGRAEMCPWGRHPQVITPQNVRERAHLLLDQYRKKSTLYRSNTLLVPLGDDFRYITTEEAEVQFVNLQKIFDHINADTSLKASVQFGTLEDYFSTLREEARAGAANAVPGFPSLSGDFFTYADRVKDYWSGYYVSRPFYKAVDRVLEQTMRAADILYTLTSAYCKAFDRSDFPLTFNDKLVSARRNLALFQHHDGVTGTAKNHVVVDYGQRMHQSVIDLLRVMSDSVHILLSRSMSNGQCKKFPSKEELEFYEPEQARERYDLLPVKTVLRGTGQKGRRVVLFNSLEEVVEQVVTVLVDDPSVCIFDSNWEPVESQASPEWDFGTSGSRPESGKHRLQWQAKVSPLGLQTYTVSPSSPVSDGCPLPTKATLQVFNPPQGFVCPAPYDCAVKTDDHVEIKNQHQSLVFGARHGLLFSVTKHDGQEVSVEEELAFYSSHRSGAYLFQPDGEAASFVEPGGLMIVVEGPLMQEVYTRPKTSRGPSNGELPVVRSARLFAGSSAQAAVAEMEYHTQLLNSAFDNKELIVRFKTGLNNKKLFYSDLNGFQTIRRKTYDKIPLQGNYYPMPSLAFLQCPSGRRFSIHSRQALGVASLGKGWLEVMLDRRLRQDDGRGLGQGVMDNHPNSVVFHLLLEKNTTETLDLKDSSSSRAQSLLSHRVGAQLDYPLHAFLGKPEPLESLRASIEGKLMRTTMAPLAQDLPCDFHVVSLQLLKTAGVSHLAKHKTGLLLQRRGFDLAYGVKKDLQNSKECSTFVDGSWNLFSLFSDLEIVNPRQSSLNFAKDETKEFGYLEQVHRKEGRAERRGPLTLDPMEISAFKLELRPR
ncbi:hypothetical protein R1flu_001814 [Riccia fluitans]|uniref:Alpha-mannosidase n=1 Tax=Riccia fluitans TaxID=41844 RepID=A0ABD1Y5F0_9MARC